MPLHGSALPSVLDAAPEPLARPPGLQVSNQLIEEVATLQTQVATLEKGLAHVGACASFGLPEVVTALQAQFESFKNELANVQADASPEYDKSALTNRLAINDIEANDEWKGDTPALHTEQVFSPRKRQAAIMQAMKT